MFHMIYINYDTLLWRYFWTWWYTVCVRSTWEYSEQVSNVLHFREGYSPHTLQFRYQKNCGWHTWLSCTDPRLSKRQRSVQSLCGRKQSYTPFQPSRTESPAGLYHFRIHLLHNKCCRHFWESVLGEWPGQARWQSQAWGLHWFPKQGSTSRSHNSGSKRQHTPCTALAVWPAMGIRFS
jgi:hypothetical protein